MHQMGTAVAPVARVLVGSALCVLSGCSAYGVTTSSLPAVAPFGLANVDRAEVCVLRSGIPTPFFTVTVHDNAMLVGATLDGTYFCYFAEPGHHSIVSDGAYGARTAALDAIGGHRYFVKQNWLFPAFRGHELVWASEATVEQDIQDAQYASLTEVPGKESLPGSPPFAPASR
jgi:hypothetical protein